MFNSAHSQQAPSPCKFIALVREEQGESWDLTGLDFNGRFSIHFVKSP